MRFLQKKLSPIVTVALFLLLCGNALGAQWPVNVVAISPAPGTLVHSLLTLLGKSVVKYTPIEKWQVQPLGGPEVWLPLMKEGKCLFANYSIPEVLKAYQGRGLYEKLGPAEVRTVAAGHSMMFMFWTTPEKKIPSLSDLKGKKVFLKYKTNPLFTEMAQKQLASAGLALTDLKSVLAFSNLDQATRALMEGWADAVLFPAVPEAVAEINQSKGECQFISLTLEQAQYVADRSPGYHLEDVPANDPRFANRSEVPNALCYQNAMFCSPALDPDVVYGVVKAIFDHSGELSDTNPLAKYWSLSYRPIALAVPYHEGAVRYFQQKGLWKPEDQAYQDKMIRKKRN
jgi:TRAP transporter TAXI family solute receptor